MEQIDISKILFGKEIKKDLVGKKKLTIDNNGKKLGEKERIPHKRIGDNKVVETKKKKNKKKNLVKFSKSAYFANTKEENMNRLNKECGSSKIPTETEAAIDNLEKMMEGETQELPNV